MTTTTTTATGMPSGQGAVELWLPLLDAAAALGVSERTMRRRVADGEVRSRMRNGRREVSVPMACQAATDTATDAGGPGGDKLAGSTATALAAVEGIEGSMAGVLALLTDELRADRRAVIEQAQTDLRRARRHAGWGWTAAGVLAVLAAAGGVWGVQGTLAARERAAGIQAALEAAQTQAAVLAERLAQTDADRRAEAARADAAVADLTGTVDELHAARMRLMLNELEAARHAVEQGEIRARLVDAAPGVVVP